MSDAAPDAGPKPMQVGDNGLYVLRDQQDVLRVARHLLETGAVPSSLRTPQQVAMAVQALNSLGLNPYAAIRQVAFINGALTAWGDLPLALARKTGLLEDFEEFRFTLDKERGYLRQCFDNSNAHLETFGAVCRVKRLNQRLHEVIYTQADAKHAGLWGKTPTWRNYPGRMMTMRARSQAIKDIFGDALAGVAIQEFDVEGVGSQPPPSLSAGDKRLPEYALSQFNQLGLTSADLKTYLGHDVATCSAAEVELLRSLAGALKNKDITWADALEARQQLTQPPQAPSGQEAGAEAEKPSAPQHPRRTDPVADPEDRQSRPGPSAQTGAPRSRQSQEILQRLRNVRRGPVPT